ncbi:MAG: putative transglycosylase [Gemmatimonadetes bacterium]|nr:putative transglycosylase [Gemmatimonadota bacterium]
MKHTLPTLGTIVLFLSAILPSDARAQSGDSLSKHVVVPAGHPSMPATVRPESAPVSSVDVARRTVELFGDSLATMPVIKAGEDSIVEPTWDMDVRSYESQERVAHYVGLFTGRSKERIRDRLERGTRYEPMIRAKLKAGGVPEDMYYLALIESGFDNNAYSRAAAVGMWQFMTSTAKGMGMRVDWWVDERRDPIKSTSAAVRFIKELKEQFGSLYLAAAAYNGGPGRIARGMTRYADDLDNTQGEDAFFVLAEKDYLKNETREYVPQLIAAALIAKEPARYGMELHPREAYAYDSVRVPPSTPLAAIAKAAGTSVATVAELNSHLLRGMTPPRDAYLVRIPTGSAAGFDSAFAELPKSDRVATKVVESKKGDTAARLANAHGISESAVVGFNPKLRRLKSGRLAPGQAILIPTAAVAAAAINVPDPSIEKYPGSTKKMKVHAVKKGESLGGIAKKYGTTSARIMKLNGLRKPMIFPGQSLIVSGAPSRTKVKAARLVKSEKSASKSGKSSKLSEATRSKPKVTTAKKGSVAAR